MINKNDLSPKKQYEVAYSVFRFFGRDKGIHDWAIDTQYQEKARLSYDNKNRRFNGWVNPVRRGHFVNRWTVWVNGGEIPF